MRKITYKVKYAAHQHSSINGRVGPTYFYWHRSESRGLGDIGGGLQRPCGSDRKSVVGFTPAHIVPSIPGVTQYQEDVGVCGLGGRVRHANYAFPLTLVPQPQRSVYKC